MIEITVEILSDVLEVDVYFPPIGATVTGVKDDVINGNTSTITDLPI